MTIKSFLAASLLAPVLSIGGVAAANAASEDGLLSNRTLIGGDVVTSDESSLTIEVSAEHEKIIEKLAEAGYELGEQVTVTIDDETRYRGTASFSEGDHVFVKVGDDMSADLITDHAPKRAVKVKRFMKHHRGGEVVSIDTDSNTMTVVNRNGEEKEIEYEDGQSFVRVEEVVEGDISVGDRIHLKSRNHVKAETK